MQVGQIFIMALPGLFFLIHKIAAPASSGTQWSKNRNMWSEDFSGFVEFEKNKVYNRLYTYMKAYIEIINTFDKNSQIIIYPWNIYFFTGRCNPKTTIKNTTLYFVWKHITFKKHILPRPVRNKLFQYFLLQVGIPQKPQKKHNFIFCLEIHNI